jgi:hypothetical protein
MFDHSLAVWHTYESKMDTWNVVRCVIKIVFVLLWTPIYAS